MDAVKFVEEVRRMRSVDRNYKIFNFNHRPEDVVKEVEEWSAAHPRKTRQSVFLEQWPNATIDTDGVLFISPCNVDARIKSDGYCKTKVDCYACRCEFWGQEVS